MKRLIILFAIAFSGCMTQKKVIQWNDAHLDKAAAYCAEKFPVKSSDTTIIAGIDSTEYLNSLQELTESFHWLNSVNDSLLHELEHKDTACRKYAPIVASLKDEMRRLESQARNIQPKIQYQKSYVISIDSAALFAQRSANHKLEDQVSRVSREKDKAENKLKVRFWIIVALSILCLLLIALLIIALKAKEKLKLLPT